MDSAPPAKRPRTSSESSTTSTQDDASTPTEEYNRQQQVIWQAQQTAKYAKSAARKKLEDILDTCGIKDKCRGRHSVYKADVEANIEPTTRDDALSALVDFMAPALRSGAQSAHGGQSGFNKDSLHLDHTVLRSILGNQQLGGNDVHRALDHCFTRVESNKERARQGYVQYQQAMGGAAGYKGDGLTWSYNNFNRQAIYNFIATNRLHGVVPDAARTLVHDSRAILADPILEPFVSEAIKNLHGIFDRFAFVDNVEIIVSKHHNSMVDAMAPYIEDIPFFTNKKSRAAIHHGWTAPDPSGASVLELLIAKAKESYRRPTGKSKGSLTVESAMVVIRTLRRRYSRDVEDESLRHFAQVERQLRRDVGREQQLSYVPLLHALGSTDEGAFMGIAVNAFDKPFSPATQLYSRIAAAVVDGSEEAVEKVVETAGINVKELWKGAEASYNFIQRGGVPASTTEDDELDELDEDDSHDDEPTTKKKGDDTGKSKQRATTSRSGSNPLFKTSGLNIYAGMPTLRTADAEIATWLEEYTSRIEQEPPLDLGASQSNDLDQEAPPPRQNFDVTVKNVVELMKTECEAATGDEYGLAMLLQALLVVHEHLAATWSVSLPSAVARCTRALARIWAHRDTLDKLGDKIVKIVVTSVLLSCVLPTAALAGVWLDAQVETILGRCDSTPEQRRVLLEILKDAHGAIIAFETFNTKDSTKVSVGATYTKVTNQLGGQDPRWMAYMVAIQEGRCFDDEICGRVLVHDPYQRRNMNQDGRHLSVNQFFRRKPLELHDDLGGESAFDCLVSLFYYLFRPGLALSSCRLIYVAHDTDKPSRGKPAPVAGARTLLADGPGEELIDAQEGGKDDKGRVEGMEGVEQAQ
ncbi:hypothetical protein JCM3775_007446 [Rhodotorula graminis]